MTTNMEVDTKKRGSYNSIVSCETINECDVDWRILILLFYMLFFYSCETIYCDEGDFIPHNVYMALIRPG